MTRAHALANTCESNIEVVDSALRDIAKRRSGLDAEEARWLREAEAAQIWRPLAMVSMIDYMERVLGHTPRAALERLRVARELAALPSITQALADGALSFSAVRALTRVAVPATEAEWRDHAAGKNMRQIEELVATHQRGDRPADPTTPDLQPRVIRFEVSPETFVRLRQARAALDAERGERLDDDQLIAALAGLALDPPTAHDATNAGRARYQIATVLCERCERGWQTAGGARVDIGSAEVERARCDAQHIGSIEASEPARAKQDVAPKVRRFVWRRDGGRCIVPGCRSGRNLEIHHLVARADGGAHDASNLGLLCDAHHAACHAGTLRISGVAPDRIVFGAATSKGGGPIAPAAVGGSKLTHAILRVQAKSALVNMGWKAVVAVAAVDEALGEMDGHAEIGEVIRAALRRCR